MVKHIWLFICIVVLGAGVACNPPKQADPLLAVLPEVEEELANGVLAAFYPRAVDTDSGGYFSAFDSAWNRLPDQQKMVVSQSRHIWTLTQAAAFYPHDTSFAPMADHGYRFLSEVMWDTLHGGFYWMVSRSGKPVGDGIKQTYGEAFALYALSAYYSLRKDSAALDLAKKTFYWIETHAHDSVHGGYHGFLTREGRVLSRTDAKPTAETIGLKDQNVMIHLLEAFTALYAVWPDPLVRTRLEECLRLIRDTITQPKGYLHLYFYPDWTPYSLRDSSEAARQRLHYYSDHVSGGHDVETAFLMLEAAEALGWEGEEMEKTRTIGRRMLDHCLDNLWDEEKGGIYDQGYYYEKNGPITVVNHHKNWWAQAEGLNAWLLFHTLYPGDPRYPEAFLKQWKYIKTYVLDSTHRGWYSLGLDTAPEASGGNKAHIWKASYHDGRSLMHVSHLLKKRKGDN